LEEERVKSAFEIALEGAQRFPQSDYRNDFKQAKV